MSALCPILMDATYCWHALLYKMNSLRRANRLNIDYFQNWIIWLCALGLNIHACRHRRMVIPPYVVKKKKKKSAPPHQSSLLVVGFHHELLVKMFLCSLSHFSYVSISWVVKVNECNRLKSSSSPSAHCVPADCQQGVKRIIFTSRCLTLWPSGSFSVQQDRWIKARDSTEGWEVEASSRSQGSRAAGELVAFTPGRRCRATAAGMTSGWW